jgi:adenylate cyclase
VFGGKRRADYTAIGQTVNLAARIEGEAKSGDILISEKVANVIGEQRCLALGDVRLKGISKPQKLFSVAPRKVERNAS